MEKCLTMAAALLLVNAIASQAKAIDLPVADANRRVCKDLSDAQAPIQKVALAADSDTLVPTASVIPPVVSGSIDLEEFKRTNVVDLKISQSRTFRFKNRIVRTSVSDPTLAESVVISENQMVLLGKAPGTCTLVLWDDAGNAVAIDLHVTRDYDQLQKTLREIDPRIIVKAFSVGGSDRVLLLGEVDHPESIIKAFAAANVFFDDRGMNISVANSRLVNARIGEQGGSGGGGAGGGGALAQLASVDKYTYFPNLTNNVSRAQVITSDGGRVTSLVKVRKVPLIVLHCTFMEMNTTAARALGIMMGFSLKAKSFAFGVGGTNTVGTSILNGSSGSSSSSGSTPVQFYATNSTTSSTGITGSSTGIGQGNSFNGQLIIIAGRLIRFPWWVVFPNRRAGQSLHWAC